MEEKYFIGLDVGTESVGWAVTDTEYNIKKFRGNAMWGIRLFDESQTAAERRISRTSRRRLDRRGERLRWLESLFAEEICKVDPEFFIRLRESGLHLEDKSVSGKYALFAGDYTDKDFHRDYPTFYRLRRELIENPAPHDIRLVFLALHHIIKSRGHFLFEELDVSDINKFVPVFEELIQYCILYSKYDVLNEINSIKIDGVPISVELKKELFNKRFLHKKKVNKKDIESFFKSKGIEFTTVTGIDDDIKSSMKSYFDFARYTNLTEEEKDDIIKAITVFGEEKKLQKKRLGERYGDRLSSDDIGRIAKLSYSGWGRFSKELLVEILSVDKTAGTGEAVNIITALWEHNLNLMQLLYSEEFDFKAAVDKAKDKNENEPLRKAVDKLYVSPKIKRPIYQALLIVREIIKTQKGRVPEKIFLEVARFEGEKNTRTKSRKTQLTELYKTCQKDYANMWDYPELSSKLKNIEDRELNEKKIFLYFAQGGRCMYTGERIDLNELKNSNSRWDIDHIYPRSKIKDDSIHNNLVLVRKEFNKGKDNEYPIKADVRAQMTPYWKYLHGKNLITTEKYNRLICASPLTDDQLNVFVNRQLVETQQSTKAIADILKEMYGKSETEIVYVKAGLVSEFRQKYDLLKSRDVNDLHHAKDAYLNIVVGNVYNVKCTHNRANFIKGLQSGKYSLKAMYDYDIKGAWTSGVSLANVKRHMQKNNVLYTRYSFKNKGELFKQQPLKKGEGQVPLKANGPRSRMEDYGAYNGATTYCFCLAKHGKEGKQKTGLFPVNLYEKAAYFDAPEKYLTMRYNLKNPTVLIPVINIQSSLSFDGFRVHIGGKDTAGVTNQYRPAMQLVVDKDNEEYIRRIFKFFDKNKGEKNPKVTWIDYLTTEKNIVLYTVLCEKMQDTIFKVFFADLGKGLTEKKEIFEGLSVEEQCGVLKEIVNILHCNAMVGDLKKIGITSKGRIRIACNVSGNGFDAVKLINQSVTGLYEYEVDLLKM